MDDILSIDVLFSDTYSHSYSLSHSERKEEIGIIISHYEFASRNVAPLIIRDTSDVSLGKALLSPKSLSERNVFNIEIISFSNDIILRFGREVSVTEDGLNLKYILCRNGRRSNGYIGSSVKCLVARRGEDDCGGFCTTQGDCQSASTPCLCDGSVLRFAGSLCVDGEGPSEAAGCERCDVLVEWGGGCWRGSSRTVLAEDGDVVSHCCRKEWNISSRHGKEIRKI